MLDFEAGLGDTLQFIRFAPLLKQRGASVMALCQTPLLRLVARCPGVDVAFDGTSAVPHCDFHISLMSLPAILGTTLDNLPARVPYLFTDPVLLDHWRSKLAAAFGLNEEHWSRTPAAPGNRASTQARPFLIGIAWQGNPKHPSDRWRSFPLAKLRP